MRLAKLLASLRRSTDICSKFVSWTIHIGHEQLDHRSQGGADLKLRQKAGTLKGAGFWSGQRHKKYYQRHKFRSIGCSFRELRHAELLLTITNQGADVEIVDSARPRKERLPCLWPGIGSEVTLLC